MQGEKFRRGLDFDHNFLDKEVRFPASAARFGRRFLRCGKYGVKNGFRFYIRVRARGATEGLPRRIRLATSAGSSLLMAKFVARNRLALQLLAVCFSGR